MADQEALMRAAAMDQETPPKAKRGRPLGSKTKVRAESELPQPESPAPVVPPQPELPDVQPELLAPIVNGFTVLLESRFGPEFHYDDQTREMLCKLVAAVANKYKVALTSKYGPEIALLIYIGVDTYPRVVRRRVRLVQESPKIKPIEDDPDGRKAKIKGSAK